MQLIDTHCHLDRDSFSKDRLEIIEHCREMGINKIVVPAIDQSGWLQLLMLCETQKGLYPALGLHPMFLSSHKDKDVKLLEKWIEDHRKQVVAVGEIGLDYYDKQLDRKRQQILFEAQLDIAQQADLPVILHVRKAHDRIIKTLKKFKVKGGIIHAYSGSEQQAIKYIDMGFKLGFGGSVTYEKAKRIHRLAVNLPLDSIVLETDAPDMVVSAHHGERNSPEYLVDVLDSLVELRDESAEDIAAQTTQNAIDVLALN
ncbi:MAG: TatD family hydrolase [Sulfuriflexus sp.]|nr:TatD family hydrolase [Sulfuriflexus sp.]